MIQLRGQIPGAKRFNALQQALMMDRDERIPFSIRRKAIEALEEVISDYEASRRRWTILLDEIERLKKENRELRAARNDPL